ncbi:MAG: LysM peptidoglycan-binding domain-containing protein [Planctomycetota bacterium]
MRDSASRAVTGLGLLVVIWVFVYWVWEPGQGPSGPLGFTEAEGPAEAQARPSEPVVFPGESAGVGDTASNQSRLIQPGFREYSVVAGDTFETIARKELGSGRLASVIARANPFKDPRRLREGEVLLVPLDPGNIQGRVASEGTEPATPPLPEPEYIEYTVQQGDTLGGISFAFYGSSRHVLEILTANQDKLSSPNSIRVGQVIRIPSRVPDSGAE